MAQIWALLRYCLYWPSSWPSLLWLGLIICTAAYAQSPPKLAPGNEEANNSRKVVLSGSVVNLACPVERPERDEIFIEWAKDGESVAGFDSRIRKTSGGTLRIKEATPEDTGLYSCKAVNGFGSIQFHVNLIVLGDDYEDINENNNDTDVSGGSLPLPGKFPKSGTKPKLTHVSKFPEQIIQRPLGGSVRFKCEASGQPKPSITWFHNSFILQTRDSRRGRWTLLINDLKVEDTGNYTCIAFNPNGNASTSFILEVIDRLRDKPELTGPHPSNTTVSEGEMATFQCRVKSEVVPHIQWLKKLESEKVVYDEFTTDSWSSSNHHIIKVEGEHYRVLKSSQVVEAGDGTFINKLLILKATQSDSGTYVCLGANAQGFRSRSAYLSVVPLRSSPHLLNPFKEQFLPFPIIVAIIAICILVIVSSLFLLIHCRYQKNANSRSNSDTSSSALSGPAFKAKPPSLALQSGLQVNKDLSQQTHHLPPPHPLHPHSHPHPHHSSHQSQFSPAPSATAFASCLYPELITDKRSSSVSPKLYSPSASRSSLGPQYQYYHLPQPLPQPQAHTQRTSYGYLC